MGRGSPVGAASHVRHHLRWFIPNETASTKHPALPFYCSQPTHQINNECSSNADTGYMYSSTPACVESVLAGDYSATLPSGADGYTYLGYLVGRLCI